MLAVDAIAGLNPLVFVLVVAAIVCALLYIVRH